jgi:hypothetical protein
MGKALRINALDVEFGTGKPQEIVKGGPLWNGRILRQGMYYQ